MAKENIAKVYTFIKHNIHTHTHKIIYIGEIEFTSKAPGNTNTCTETSIHMHIHT